MKRPAVFLLCLALLLVPACGEEKTPSTDAPPVESGSGNGGTAGSGGGASLGGPGLDDALRAEVAAAMTKGRAWLLAQQEDSGAFGDKTTGAPGNVSYTAMAAHAVIAATPKTQVKKDAVIDKALAFLMSKAQPNGSIVDDPRFTNYATGVSVSALAAARIAKYAKTQAAAADYLAQSQIADEKDLSYGGFPYKQHKGQSADASNAVIAASALDDHGLPADSAVRKRVEAFARKVQNHSETNTGERRIVVDDEERVVVSSDDGGGLYRPDESKAGMVKRADGRWELKSYGSMTYAVLKLLLFAGLSEDDARVKALVRWLSNHWTVARNPGFEGNDDPEKAGQQGFYYYLYTLSRALSAYERATKKPLVVTDSDGRRHDWRSEVARELLSRQDEDGSWINKVAERWEEGSRTLSTSFAMQALGYVTGRLE